MTPTTLDPGTGDAGRYDCQHCPDLVPLAGLVDHIAAHTGRTPQAVAADMAHTLDGIER